MRVYSTDPSNVKAREAAEAINKMADDAGYNYEDFDWFMAQIAGCQEGIREMLDLDTTNDAYEACGYTNRHEYLESLAEDYGVPLHEIYAISETIGQDEDFGALILALQHFGSMQ